MDMPLSTIYKLFKLLKDRPWQNKETIKNLKIFFQNWEIELINRVTCAANDLQTAELEAEETRKYVASFGTMATEEMENDLREELRAVSKLQTAVKKTKSKCERVKKLTSEIKAID